ncbi:MAG: outer membrane protein assembly factor BamD, partial [Betaproteobacteria bacterium]|nr:outer membrane protein assembly factor BamD [Betaproteobacteria bacterium]
MLRCLRLSVLLCLAWLTGCATTEADWTAGWTPEKLYAEARDEMDNKAYEKAIKLYEKLEGRAAGTQLAQQAQLEKAYAYFKNGEPVLAVSTLDRFIKVNPVSPAMDYALYLKGIVNFNDDLGLLSFVAKQDLAERDQKAAKESFEA